MSTLFLTGIGGFLGRHIASHFAQNGWRVAGVDALASGDARPPVGVEYTHLPLPAAELPDLLRSVQPDVFIHCAGSASVPLSMREPGADYRANTALVFEMLDSVRRSVPACRFLLLSSAAVYGNPEILPVTESARVAPLSPYGFHKRQAEILLEEFAVVYGLRTVSARIFSAYGPSLRRQVVWDICERVLTKDALSLGGTGRESRDFIHPVDVASGLEVLATAAPARGEAYNLASGRETTLSELATLAKRVLGREEVPTIFEGNVRAGDPLNWRADISRISALGFQPRMSLEAGLAETGAWVRSELGIAAL